MKTQLKKLEAGKAIPQDLVQVTEAVILTILRVVPDLLVADLEVEDLETLVELFTEIDVFGIAKIVTAIFLKKEDQRKKKRRKNVQKGKLKQMQENLQYIVFGFFYSSLFLHIGRIDLRSL